MSAGPLSSADPGMRSMAGSPVRTPNTGTQLTLPDANPTPLEAALASLAASRQRLRLALIPPDDVDGGPLDARGRPQPGAWPRSLAGWWRRGRRALQAWPVADLAAGLLQDWWQHHPWRSTGEHLAETARHAVLPLVRRHPLSALLGAVALGAALVAGRAWCWPAVRAIRPAAARSGRRWLVAQLANPAMLTALLSTLMLVIKELSAQRTTPAPTAAASASSSSPSSSPSPSPAPKPSPPPAPTSPLAEAAGYAA